MNGIRVDENKKIQDVNKLCLTAITPDLDTIKANLRHYDNTDIIRSVLWVGQVIGHENIVSLAEFVENSTAVYDNIHLIDKLQEGPQLKKQKKRLVINCYLCSLYNVI